MAVPLVLHMRMCQHQADSKPILQRGILFLVFKIVHILPSGTCSTGISGTSAMLRVPYHFTCVCPQHHELVVCSFFYQYHGTRNSNTPVLLCTHAHCLSTAHTPSFIPTAPWADRHVNLPACRHHCPAGSNSLQHVMHHIIQLQRPPPHLTAMYSYGNNKLKKTSFIKNKQTYEQLGEKQQTMAVVAVWPSQACDTSYANFQACERNAVPSYYQSEYGRYSIKKPTLCLCVPCTSFTVLMLDRGCAVCPPRKAEDPSHGLHYKT